MALRGLKAKRKRHVWRTCAKKSRFCCTSYSTEHGRCDADAVVHCTRRSHADRYGLKQGCEARCPKHKPRLKKDFKQAICTAPCACTSAEASMDECACINNKIGFCRKCGCALHEIWVSTGERVKSEEKAKKGAKR